jgi:hypothetical protein
LVSSVFLARSEQFYDERGGKIAKLRQVQERAGVTVGNSGQIREPSVVIGVLSYTNILSLITSCKIVHFL